MKKLIITTLLFLGSLFTTKANDYQIIIHNNDTTYVYKDQFVTKQVYDVGVKKDQYIEKCCWKFIMCLMIAFMCIIIGSLLINVSDMVSLLICLLGIIIFLWYCIISPLTCIIFTNYTYI